jgi:signal transduction histidine kinase
VPDTLLTAFQQLPLIHLLTKIVDCLPRSNYDLILSSGQVFLHACRTPLAAIRCNVESSLEDSDKHLLSHRLKSISLATRQLEQLVRCVDEKQRRILERQVFSIKAAVVQAICVLQAVYPTARITTNISQLNRIDFVGREILFQEALCCLIKNALESYLDLKGHQAKVEVRVLVDEQQIKIDIRDWGQGMGSIKLFLAQAKGVSFKQCGHGIGLPFARQVIEREFGGNLVISSVYSIGTTVTIKLPIQNTLASHHVT